MVWPQAVSGWPCTSVLQKVRDEPRPSGSNCLTTSELDGPSATEDYYRKFDVLLHCLTISWYFTSKVRFQTADPTPKSYRYQDRFLGEFRGRHKSVCGQSPLTMVDIRERKNLNSSISFPGQYPQCIFASIICKRRRIAKLFKIASQSRFKWRGTLPK